MSDWQIGDLAVCVDDSDMDGSSSGSCKYVRIGQVYRVRGVLPRILWLNMERHQGLVVAETSNPFGPHGAFSAQRFRKIRPDEHQSCEPEFVTLLNRIKRKVTA